MDKLVTKQQDEVEKKLFRGYLLLNWKTTSMRVVKRFPEKVKPYEIPIRIDCVINLPKNPEILAKGEFTIPQTKVNEMVLDML